MPRKKKVFSGQALRLFRNNREAGPEVSRRRGGETKGQGSYGNHERSRWPKILRQLGD